ncbi:ras guanine nucleotide exchange factor domain-containing protein [Russula brevipes]|nr:ras guanine nucleotide exchange factor domain-containing protein [Russula brevipes]
MSPQNIVPAAGFSDVSRGGLLIASSLIRTAKNVKIYQAECEHLGKQCLDLASTLHDHSPGLEGTSAQQVVDEVERVLTRILNRVRKWVELGKMRSFVKQTEIRMGLDESYQELRTCAMRFNIALHLNASSRTRELEEIRRRDHGEIVEMMTRALHDQNLLKVALAHSTPEDAHQELNQVDVGETQERQLQEDIGELRNWVERLPPMVDLSGQVIRTSDHAIASGGSQDIHTGEWTGTEVALACPRNQSRAAQERFQRQVEIWRTLRHPNILQLLGIAYLGISCTHPYMEFGNVIRYLKDHPEADRLLLLSEIASAAEYLHLNGIIHGDLQGSNVLVSGDGHACLGDFGSARIEEAPVTEAITYGSLRWLAPELIASSSSVLTARATDVWSFGMLSIEIFTDNVPFSHVSNEAYIPLLLRDGPLPTRPDHSVTMRGLSDALWDLMNQCWQRDPVSRPSMSQIREAIQNTHPLRSSSRLNIPQSSFTLPRSYRGNTLSSAVGIPGGARPSALSLSRPSRSAGLTPPTAPLPLSRTSARDEAELEQFQRGLPASFPLRRSPILKNMPLSSSPPSIVTSSSRSTSGRPTPSPNPSPLSAGFRAPLPSTTPESQTSISPPSPRGHWSLRPALYSPEASISSPPELSLLLQPIHVTSRSKPDSSHSTDEVQRSASTSTGSIFSMDRMSTSSAGGLLDAAVRDAEPLLRRAPDGTVEAGTLEGLVDRVIRDTHDRAKDDEMKKVFLATYSLFTTGEDLFRVLKRRFEETGDAVTSITTGPIRYPILLFLRTWLRGEGERMDCALLASIREFAISVDGSNILKEVVREVVNLAGEKLNVVVPSPRPLPLRPQQRPSSPSSPEQFKARDIAVSLSVIEGECYSEITQADYMAHLRGTPITAHIASTTKTNNRLMNWVKMRILSPEDVMKRATNFKRFVLTAEECKKLQNFSSMSAIVAALRSIPQLILTRESQLTKSDKLALRQLEEILSPKGEHSAYHEALRNVKSPFAIPWLAVHLHGLQAFYDRNSAAVVVDQRPLINFSRCARLLERIDDVRQYRAPPDLLEKHRGAAAALTWVRQELDSAPSAISREQFEARVSGLGELERKMRERRELELRSLGFDPAPRHNRKSSSGSHSSAQSSVTRMASLDSRSGRT